MYSLKKKEIKKNYETEGKKIDDNNNDGHETED
jgi:hypothetical protein